MTARAPVFVLVPIEDLLIHEEIEPGPLRALEAEIRQEGRVRDPIWVARGSGVVLNGHHRLAVLRSLGAARAPSWLLDYDDPRIRLDRWGPGPPLTKEEVLRRARAGRPFPPKTTRHRLDFELPGRPTDLHELLGAPAVPGPGSAPAAARPRPRRSGTDPDGA